MKSEKLLSLIILITILFTSCNGTKDPETDIESYTGTAAVSQGEAELIIVENLFPEGSRIAGLGEVMDVDGGTWVVPSVNSFENESFPTAPDLYNPYGVKYTSSQDAIDRFSAYDIVEIDTEGEVITAFIFADNYFELYIKDMPVGKDAVPFTDFNSHIVQFKVNRPFTVSMLLIDWEEHLGVGCEDNQGFAFHPGDGGMVAVFMDANQNIIGVTDDTWKAQTFYTAPIKDLSCPSEEGTLRLSNGCSTTNSTTGSKYYALHWPEPANWIGADFDDSDWPSATLYTNEEIGVDNKQAYTNFTDVFDNQVVDAQFIWSTNVVLDNKVIVRKTIQ